MSNLNGDTLISQKISEVQDIEHKLIPYSPQRILEVQDAKHNKLVPYSPQRMLEVQDDKHKLAPYSPK